MRKLVSVFTCWLAMGTGAFAQDSGIFIANVYGEEIQLSPENVYRALGDRRVAGRDIIGNSTLNWNQIDESLPGDRIRVALPGEQDAGMLRDAIRAGCYMESGNRRACHKVGIRLDRIIYGAAFASAGVARFDPQRMTLAPPPPPPPPPPPAPEPSMTSRIKATPAYVRPANGSSMSGAGNAAPTTITVEVLAPMSTPQPAPPPAAMVMPPSPAPLAPNSEPMMMPEVQTAKAQEATPAQERVYASRLFLGRESFPPDAFAAYGILAFQTLSTSEDAMKYLAICEAFFTTLINSGDAGVDVSKQMVTVWPIDDRNDPDLTSELNTTRVEDGSCERAINYYDILVARDSIEDAKAAGFEMTGRGPFLLAWSPAGMKGKSDAIVLTYDLSDVKNVKDAQEMLLLWREKIEGDPALWKDGFSAETLRVKLRQIADRYGAGLLKFLGG